MKTRLYFVSNSSSSSFTCDISGEAVSGWDLCLSEAEMSQCINGHVFKNEYLDKELTNSYYREFAIKAIEEDNLDTTDEDLIEDYIEDIKNNDDELPTEVCPICQLEYVADYDITKYLVKLVGMKDKTEITNQIIEKYGDNPVEFYKFINS